MPFRDRLFAALAKEIEDSQKQTAVNSASVLMAIENYHFNVGYYNALNMVVAAMEKLEKQEEGKTV